jgi:hypothetical protein
MKGRYGVILAVFGFIIFFFSMEAWAADWKYIFTAATGGEWFYDTQSVSRGQDITSVWTKWILSDKERAKFIKEFPEEFEFLQEGARKTQGRAQKICIENISYFIEKEEINCSKNVARIMSMSLYGSGGEVIWSSGAQKPNQFEDVFPDSKGITLVKAICK